MHSDIDTTTQQETDAVVERIMQEWAWQEGYDAGKRKEMRIMQEKILVMREKIKEHNPHTEDYQLLQENIKVASKQLHRMWREFLKNYE